MATLSRVLGVVGVTLLVPGAAAVAAESAVRIAADVPGKLRLPEASPAGAGSGHGRSGARGIA